MRRAFLLAALAAALGGCAVPAWVPWIGRSAEEPPARAPAAAPRREEAIDPRGVHRVPPRLVDDEVADRIIAVVNNDAITLGELQESIIAYRQESRQQSQATDEELAEQFLSRLIDTRLQLQEAEREKITVDEAEVDQELEDRMKRYGVQNRDEFEILLRQEGLNLDSIKKRLRDTLRIAKVVRRKVALRVSVTEQEIDRYLESNRDKLETGLGYHARHILTTPEGTTDVAWESARIRAEMIRKQLEEGAEFAEMARQHSRDASARDGGDLGPLKRGELAQDIEAEILRLAPGEVSPPYRSALGYHIFRLESKETLEGQQLQRARQQIRDILFRQKYEARLEEWLREIKQRAIIEVRM